MAPTFHGLPSSLYHVLSWALVLLVVPTLVAGIHPKHKNLLSNVENLEPQQDEGQFYRIRRQQPSRNFLMSMRQFRAALDEMNRNIRSLENKLMRHEYREAQVADFSVKTLNSLTAGHTLAMASIMDMAKQLAAVEEKVMAVLTLVATSDERQRLMITKVSEGLNRLLLASTEPTLGRSPNALPELPPEVALSLQSTATIEKDVKNIIRKMVEMDGNHDNRIRGVSSEVRQLSDSMGRHMGQVSSGQELILGAVQTCAEKKDAVDTNSEESVSCLRMEREMGAQLEDILGMQRTQVHIVQDLKESTANVLGQQEAGLQALLREMRQEGSYFNGSFASILEGLQDLEETSRQNLGNLYSNLNAVVDESSSLIRQRLEAMEASLQEKQDTIMGALDDTASMTDTLQRTVDDNYDELSKEISGLNKVEQVMINTADAVLDTKRSIEFGIQQIILELGEIVSKSGSTINTTLSNQINAISFNILKNQTVALASMTQRMEGEISRVWRQIGNMYQQVEQSITMLDNIQDTTKLHMNVSLTRVGSMDGTVGEISGKVTEVESNLNYLLGRLSLVLSEFNHMKVGVGNELDKLREMAQVIRIPNGDQEGLAYNINKKRHVIQDLY